MPRFRVSPPPERPQAEADIATESFLSEQLQKLIGHYLGGVDGATFGPAAPGSAQCSTQRSTQGPKRSITAAQWAWMSLSSALFSGLLRSICESCSNRPRAFLTPQEKGCAHAIFSRAPVHGFHFLRKLFGGAGESS